MQGKTMILNLPDSWDLEADVVAIGSGHGLAATITAHDHGASALVLERSDLVGGVMSFSLGEMWIPGNPLEAELGIEDSIESATVSAASKEARSGTRAVMSDRSSSARRTRLKS